ncbi:hypothetical protein KO02_00285 [Sphingobacterium sp. ML3W]|uniref:hypothetical protein n=1 Tax=Sphingobacterium sp. ML3W TaxID=1538644 RepID=UPI0004F774A1|nr:hypothetical protein [Sphingobacterium sp. ML3W]AIM35275.1 hypothetical protein KO02_00285 [Sphingobacterium sp. ML3W]
MRIYLYLVLFALVWSAIFSTDVLAQWRPTKISEAKLVTQIMKLNEAKSETEIDFADSVFVHSLRKELICFPETFSFSFPRLSEYVKIVSSSDGQIKFYSWQLPIDGNRRRIQVMAQFKTMEDEKVVQQLQYSEKVEQNSSFENGIYAVYPIEYGNATVYLTFGWGTYGEGMQHNVISLYRIEKDSLVKALEMLPQKQEIIIQYPRTAKCELQYDVISKEISYSSYSQRKDMGYYYPDGNRIRLRLMETGFVKQ